MKKTQSLNRMLHLAGLPLVESVGGAEFDEAAELAQRLVDTLQDIIDTTEFVHVQDKAELLKGKIETVRREMLKTGDSDVEEKVSDELDRAEDTVFDTDEPEADEPELTAVDDDFGLSNFEPDVEPSPSIDVPGIDDKV